MQRLRRPCAPALLRLGAGLGLILCPSVHAADRARGDVLPLRSVRLYEAGVGYFERSGSLSGNATSLPVPAGHIDDALKTLVVLGHGAGQASVAGLTFPSSVSRGMGRALAGLPQDEDPISHHALLAALRGAAVEVRTTSGTLNGRLIEVIDTPAETLGPQPKPADKAAPAAAEHAPQPVLEPGGQALLVLTDRGELRRLRPREVLGVRPLDPAYAARLGAALDAPDSKNPRGAQVLRSLRLSARAGGPVTLGYVAEAPLYRISYRLIFDRESRSGSAAVEDGRKAGEGKAGQGALQGWALLHNDADEDWREVRVHLVSGRPDSFLFPLAAPRYGRRELLHPERALSTVPQLLGTTADTIWGDNVGTEIGEALGAGGLGLVGHGSGGGGVGYGRGVATGRGTTEGDSGLLSVGNLAALAQAQGVESGALFTYSLAAPLSLPAHSSALVPVLQSSIPAEAITWFAGEGESARSAVRLKNGTTQTLPEGPIAFFSEAAGGFSGEAILPRMKPGEQRFLQFGADLDVELSVVKSRQQEEPRRLIYRQEKLETHFLRHTEKTYEIKSRAGGARAVHLLFKVHKNATISGADRLEYDTGAEQPVAVFALLARQQLTRLVKTTEGLSRQQRVDQVSAKELSALADAPGLPAAERAAVKEAALRRGEVEALQKENSARQEEVTRVEQDLTRWRDNLKALGGGDKAPAGHPFVKRVLELEDRRQVLQRQREEAQVEIERRAGAVRAALVKLPGLKDE